MIPKRQVSLEPLEMPSLRSVNNIYASPQNHIKGQVFDFGATNRFNGINQPSGLSTTKNTIKNYNFDKVSAMTNKKSSDPYNTDVMIKERNPTVAQRN